MAELQTHWQDVYQGKSEQQTSWFRPHLDQSLRMIDALALAADAPIIDVGGGRSTLADDLSDRGFHELCVLDVSTAALQEAASRLGTRAQSITWISANVLDATLPESGFALWHDRALFHFLRDAGDRQRYIALARRSLRPGGYLLLACFAPDGPARCSGLEVCRYDAQALAALFAEGFTPLAASAENHVSASGALQPFTYILLQRDASGAEQILPDSTLRSPARATD